MSQTFRLPVDYKKQVKKSVFNLDTVRRSTLLPGMIIPIYSKRMLAGDKFVFDPRTLLKSLPLSSPLYGSYLLQCCVFFDSDANYYGYLDNNSKRSTQELLSKKSHHFDFSQYLSIIGAEVDGIYAKSLFNGTFNNFRGSVLEYMGIPSGFIPVDGQPVGLSSLDCDLGFVLTYLNIFRNYYSNKQSNLFPVIGTIDYNNPDESKVDITWNNDIQLLDDLFMQLRNSQDGINFNNPSSIPSISWFRDYLQTLCGPSGGILLTTYLPDYYRNLLDDTFNNKVSRVSTSGNSFTIDSLRFANKLQRLVDRFDISGGRFSDWLRTVWGVETRKDMDIPEFIGASQVLIDPSQVTAQSSAENVPLGDFGGNFDKFNGHRKHSLVASTPGRVMVCVSLVPHVDYTQGIDPEILEVNMADRYFPEFEQLGYQKIPGYQYQANPDFSVSFTEDAGNEDVSNYSFELSSDYDPNASIGKQVAWLSLMTDVNRCYGEFGNNGIYENWVIKRRYQYPVVSKSEDDQGNPVYTKSFVTRINQYVNPLEFQDQFITKGLMVPDWFLQTGLNVKAVRPKGKRFMPNLE